MIKMRARRKEDERVLSTSLWAHVVPILPFLILFIWLYSIDWLHLLGGWLIVSFVLMVSVGNYFGQAVALHEDYIRVDGVRLFKRDIVAVKRGRFVVKLRDEYGETAVIRRWI